MAASQNSLQHRVPYYHAFPVCQFSKFPPHGLREYVRIRPAVRINLASKNRTVIPAKRRLHKIPKHHTTETRRPVRETFRQRIDLAGLLTDPCPEAFPPRGAVAEIFGTSRGFTAAGLSGIYTRFPFNPNDRNVHPKPIRGKDSGNYHWRCFLEQKIFLTLSAITVSKSPQA